MGSIKDKKKKSKEYSLTEYEYNFIKSIAVARNQAYNQYQVIISTFLSYLAGSKWGFNSDMVLDFELDDEKKSVFISEHPKDQIKSTEKPLQE